MIKRFDQAKPMLGQDEQLNAYLEVFGSFSAEIQELKEALESVILNSRLANVFKISETLLFEWVVDGTDSNLVFYGSNIDFITPVKTGTGLPVAGVTLPWVNGAYICLDVHATYPVVVEKSSLTEVLRDDVYIVGHMHYLGSKRGLWLNGFDSITEPEVQEGT